MVICLFCGQFHFFPSMRSSVLQGAGPCKLPSPESCQLTSSEIHAVGGTGTCVAGGRKREALILPLCPAARPAIPRWQRVLAVVAAGRSELQWCWLLGQWQQQPRAAVGSSGLRSSSNSIRRFRSRCRLHSPSECTTQHWAPLSSGSSSSSSDL